MSDLSELLDYWPEDDMPGRREFVDVPELERFKDVTATLVGGVYVLLLGIVIVYVGQAKCFALRIGQHKEQRVIKFDSVKVFPCEHKGRRMAMEKMLIQRYNPKWNTKYKTEPKPANLPSLSEIMARRKGPTLIVDNTERINRRF